MARNTIICVIIAGLLFAVADSSPAETEKEYYPGGRLKTVVEVKDGIKEGMERDLLRERPPVTGSTREKRELPGHRKRVL